MAESEEGWRAHLRRMFGEGFSPAYLGTVFILIWNQCVLYAQRVQVDGGMTTIEINFARCACIAVLAVFALRPGFKRFPRPVEVVSVALMTLGSLLFLVQGATGANLELAASIACGIGLTWGGGMWIEFYKRLDSPRAFAYALASLMLSALVGALICFIPVVAAFYLGILLPVVSYVCYLNAQRSLDAAQGKGSMPEHDDVYSAEPRSTIWRMAVGIALFSLVLGVSRGFPDGSSVALPPLFQVLQYVFLLAGLGVTLVALFNGRGRPSIVPAWLSLLLLLAAGVLVMATASGIGMVVGATVLSAVNLAQVALLWVLAYDIARHTRVPACAVLGFFWLLHLLFRETGRLVILWLGPTFSHAQVLLVALLILLIALSMGLLLTDKIPHTRAFFSDFAPELAASRASIAPASDAGAVSPTAMAAPNAGGSTVSIQPEESAPSVWDDERFGLTAREREVAALLAQGRTTKVVASELCLSNETVRGYAKSIYAKLGIHSKQELIELSRKQSADGAR